MMYYAVKYLVFFFNDTAPTEIYTLSLHDALPIFERRLEQLGEGRRNPDRHLRVRAARLEQQHARIRRLTQPVREHAPRDRKSTRLNSSHANISYAVFCLKKKQTHAWPSTRQQVRT